MPQVSAPRGQPASSGAASPSPGAKPGAAALSQHASLREAEERAHRRRVVSETGQLGEWGTLSEIDLARPLRGSQRRQADVVERADADHGSAGNKLSTVVHSHAHVPERLKGSIDQGVIYVYDQTRVERSGVGIVFVLLQPYHTTDTPQAASPSGAAEEEEIRILSVDHNGPADKGQARKGDMLVGVDGHLVKGKTWEEVRELVEGPIGSFVNLAFERRSLVRPPRNSNFGTTLQAVSSSGVTATFSLRVLRGGHKVVRADLLWPDPEAYTRRSLLLFKRDIKVRRIAILLCESAVWDKFILACILVSSILLMVVDPLDTPLLRPRSAHRERVEIASNGFTLLFALEAIIQIIARGFFFGKHSYLKNGWNILDLMVVMIGIMDLIPSLRGLNLTALRALRVLRPLRAIKRIEALKVCIETLLQSANDMINVLAIVAFLCLVFSIAGVQLLGGVLRYRCVHQETGLLVPGELCQSETGAYIPSRATCAAEHQCLPQLSQPIHGLANFDSTGAAFMSSIQVILLEGWSQVCYDILDAHSPSFIVYFVVLILVGPMFTQLLFKAVLANCLTKLEDDIHNTRLLRAVAYWRLRRLARPWNKWYFIFLSRERYLQRTFASRVRDPTLRAQMRLILLMWFNVQGLKAWNSWKMHYQHRVSSKPKDKASVIGFEDDDGDMEAMQAKDIAQTRALKRLADMRAGKGTAQSEDEVPPWVPMWGIAFYSVWRSLKRQVLKVGRLYGVILKFSKSQTLEDVSTSVVALNVLSMTLPHTLDSTFGGVWASSMEHSRFHGGLDALNIAVALFFVLECLLKVWGYGPRAYLTQVQNVFDLCIVVISAVEVPSMLTSATCKLGAERLTECGGATNFMLLRVLRLLRLARVLRAFPNFQAQVKVATEVFAEIAASFALLCLFLMVFSILGCSLFGGRLRAPFVDTQVSRGQRLFVRLSDEAVDKPGVLVGVDAVLHPLSPWKVALVPGFSGYTNLDEAPHVWLSHAAEGGGHGDGHIVGISPRSGFDTLLQSVVSVFQILGGSGWPEVMKMAIEATDMSSVVYFYSLLFVGSLVLFNLFVAVIIVAFNRQVEVKTKEERLDRMPFLELKRAPGQRRKKGLYGRVYNLLMRFFAFVTRRKMQAPRDAEPVPGPIPGAAAAPGSVDTAAANTETAGATSTRPIKSSAKKKLAKSAELKGQFFRKLEAQKTSFASLIGRELWKRKIDVIEEADWRQFQDDERERRQSWKFRPRSQLFDKFQERYPPRKRWVDERAGPNEWVKGTIVEWSREEGYKVVYATETLIGFDLEEMLHPHEMDRRLLEQTHLHWVQTELTKQRRMATWQLGPHLASNLDNAVRLLEEKLELIRALDNRILTSTEFAQELERVKSTYRIGRIMHLMQLSTPFGRSDMTQAMMLTSPLGTDTASHQEGAQRSAPSVGRAARKSQRIPSREAIAQDKLVVDSEAHAAGKKRVKFKSSKLTEVLEMVKNAENISGMRADGSAAKSAAGQSTGFLKLEQQRIETVIQRIRLQQTALTAGILTGNTCFCLYPLHPVRTTCASIIQHPLFPVVINLTIACSCVSMLAERPGASSEEQQVFSITNLVFSIIFILEAILNIVSLGFGIYLRNPWNRLDFFIVISSVGNIIITFAVRAESAANVMQIAKVLRIFRAARPLKVVLQSEGLVVVIRALTDSILPLMSTMVISFLVVAIFAIVGMELLQGGMHYCSDQLIFLPEDCIGADAHGNARRWLNFDRNFDWFGESWVTVFIVGTQDDWQQVLFAATDSGGVGKGLQRHAQEWIFIFFLLMILMVAFFQMNMWTGVFVSLYFKATDLVEQDVVASLNAKAASRRKKWPKREDLPFIEAKVDLDINWFAAWKPDDGMRLPVRKFTIDDRFDLLIAAGIIINIILMTIQSFKPSSWQQQCSTVQNMFFTQLFGGEVVAKMYGLHPNRFMRDGWYQFDFLITVISFAGIAIEESGTAFSFDPTILRIMRIFRIVRIIKAMKIFRHSKRLFGTMEALKNVFPIASSLLLLFASLILIFGVTSVVLFGHMCVQGDENLAGARANRCRLIDPKDRLHQYASFQNVLQSSLALFRVATGDAWSSLMLQADLDKALYPRTPGALEQAAQLLQTLAPFETPVGSGEDEDREKIFQQARNLLGGCLSDQELNFLRMRKLVDCSRADQEPFEADCTSTCGNGFSSVFFSIYLCISNFVLINLLLAVLMKQLRQTNRDSLTVSFINERLPKHTFVRAVEVWRSNALRHNRFKKMLYKTNRVVITQDIRGLGQVLELRAGQICTMLGFWELKSHVKVQTLDGLEGLAPTMYVKPYQLDSLLSDQQQPEHMSSFQRDVKKRGGQTSSQATSHASAPIIQRHSVIDSQLHSHTNSNLVNRSASAHRQPNEQVSTPRAPEEDERVAPRSSGEVDALEGILSGGSCAPNAEQWHQTAEPNLSRSRLPSHEREDWDDVPQASVSPDHISAFVDAWGKSLDSPIVAAARDKPAAAEDAARSPAVLLAKPEDVVHRAGQDARGGRNDGVQAGRGAGEEGKTAAGSHIAAAHIAGISDEHRLRGSVRASKAERDADEQALEAIRLRRAELQEKLKLLNAQERASQPHQARTSDDVGRAYEQIGGRQGQEGPGDADNRDEHSEEQEQFEERRLSAPASQEVAESLLRSMLSVGPHAQSSEGGGPLAQSNPETESTWPTPSSASRGPKHRVQPSPAADATLGHLVSLGGEIPLEQPWLATRAPAGSAKPTGAARQAANMEGKIESHSQPPLATRRPDLGLTKDERAIRAQERADARVRRQQVLERLGKDVAPRERTLGQ